MKRFKKPALAVLHSQTSNTPEKKKRQTLRKQFEKTIFSA